MQFFRTGCPCCRGKISDALAAALGKETTGTWDIEGVELVEYSSSGTSISGYLCFADNDQVYFSQRDEELNLFNNSITTELRKLTQEEIDALLKGTDALIGEWTSVRVSEGAEEAEDTSYHLTIAEDGTFTANEALVPVLQSATGTWALAISAPFSSSTSSLNAGFESGAACLPLVCSALGDALETRTPTARMPVFASGSMTAEAMEVAGTTSSQTVCHMPW